MMAMVWIYLVLTLIFLVAGVGIWILRGFGFREFRREAANSDKPPV